MFSIEPTDRALAGWCALPRHLETEGMALSFLFSYNGPLYGDTRALRDTEE